MKLHFFILLSLLLQSFYLCSEKEPIHITYNSFQGGSQELESLVHGSRAQINVVPKKRTQRWFSSTQYASELHEINLSSAIILGYDLFPENEVYSTSMIQQNFGYDLLHCLDVRAGLRCRIDDKNESHSRDHEISFISGLYFKPLNFFHLYLIGVQISPYIGLNQLISMSMDHKSQDVLHFLHQIKKSRKVRVGCSCELDLGLGINFREGIFSSLSFLSLDAGTKVGSDFRALALASSEEQLLEKI